MLGTAPVGTNESELCGMGYSVRHVMHTDIDTFWRLHFDETVARALIGKFGDAGDFRIIEDRFDEAGHRHRRVEVWSKVEMPSLVKKFVGDGSYTEIGRWDCNLKRYSAECIPKVNGEKFRTRYEVITHPHGGGYGSGQQCEREIVTENVVKMLGVRGMIEKMLEKAQRESHDQSASFINEWIRTRL